MRCQSEIEDQQRMKNEDGTTGRQDGPNVSNHHVKCVKGWNGTSAEHNGMFF